MIKHNFNGWKPDIPDQRDFTCSLKSMIAPPSKVDLHLSKFMPPIYDQGELGSCTANGIGAAWEYELKKQGLSDIMRSRLFIYYNERVIEKTVKQDAGAQIRDGIKTVGKEGVCNETEWPYIIEKFAIKPTRNCYKSALKNIALRYERLLSTEEYKQALAQEYLVVFGMSVYESFESPDVAKTGIVPMPAANEQLLGGHCVTLIGYDDSSERFICRNSWGTEWGMNGYFTLPYAYFKPELTDDFWVIQLVK